MFRTGRPLREGQRSRHRDRVQTATSVLDGVISVTLTAPSKKAMRTVNVVARNIDTKGEATATTDDEGRFRIVGLQPGHYIVEVTAPGFTSLAVANAVVEVGRA